MPKSASKARPHKSGDQTLDAPKVDYKPLIETGVQLGIQALLAFLFSKMDKSKKPSLPKSPV